TSTSRTDAPSVAKNHGIGEISLPRSITRAPRHGTDDRHPCHSHGYSQIFVQFVNVRSPWADANAFIIDMNERKSGPFISSSEANATRLAGTLSVTPA